MRVPSSSNSSSVAQHQYGYATAVSIVRTNGDGLDSDTLLEMSIGSIIGILSGEDLLSTESVHKCSSSLDMSIANVPSRSNCRRTCARGTANHQAELNTLLDILLPADLDL